MTSAQPGGERDWDAEFDAIAQHLRSSSGTPGATDDVRPASRHTFEHGFDAGSAAHTENPVPGFRAQWRMPDIEQPADRKSPSTLEPHSEAPDAQDDFVPPEPQPLETDDPATVIMLGSLTLGPLWLLYLLLFDRYAATLWWSAALAITAAGFVMAVVRQPKSRDDNDDDDGAHV